MSEPDRSDDFFQIGINRILIKLAVRKTGRERGCPEVQAVLIQMHATGEDTFLGKTHSESAVDRPIVFRCESKIPIIQPSPCSCDCRRDLDARSDALFHLRQRSSGFAKYD